jgi:hypothetical protein
MATKNSKPITYSTAENFNPLQDYNVGYQTAFQNEVDPKQFGGVNNFNQFSYADVKNLDRPVNTKDFQHFSNQAQLGKYGINSTTDPRVKNTTYGQPTARYETKDSARIAAQHNAGITYDRDIGYVPKAGRVPSTPEQITQRARDNTAAREAANSPADMAAYRANTYAKEAARKRAAGDIQSAERWQRSAAEETAKARQLGYTGDISKATINNPERTASKPSTSTASTPKPAPATTAPKPTSSGRDWDKRPPINDSEVIAYERDMAAGQAATTNDPWAKDKKDQYKEVKGHMDAMDARNKRTADMKNQFATNDKIKDLKSEITYDRKAEQNWKDKAAKATNPAQKEHALQMAGEFADKARKREAEIAELEKGSKTDIPKLSKADEQGKTPSTTDPMADLMAGIPTMNNSSAYNAGGASGFFTRDGKVIPITA